MFLGTLLEGETILLSAGFAANRGLLHWPLVVAVAFVGARWATRSPSCSAAGRRFPDRAFSGAGRAPRVHALLERHDVLLILSVRFLYGLRIAGPVIIGTSGVPFLRFALLNMLGAAIWAVLVAGAGYYFGVALTAVVADIKRIEAAILIGIPAAGFIVWLWRRRHAASPRVRP